MPGDERNHKPKSSPKTYNEVSRRNRFRADFEGRQVALNLGRELRATSEAEVEALNRRRYIRVGETVVELEFDGMPAYALDKLYFTVLAVDFNGKVLWANNQTARNISIWEEETGQEAPIKGGEEYIDKSMFDFIQGEEEKERYKEILSYVKKGYTVFSYVDAKEDEDMPCDSREFSKNALIYKKLNMILNGEEREVVLQLGITFTQAINLLKNLSFIRNSQKARGKRKAFFMWKHIAPRHLNDVKQQERLHIPHTQLTLSKPSAFSQPINPYLLLASIPLITSVSPPSNRSYPDNHPVYDNTYDADEARHNRGSSAKSSNSSSPSDNSPNYSFNYYTYTLKDGCRRILTLPRSKSAINRVEDELLATEKFANTQRYANKIIDTLPLKKASPSNIQNAQSYKESFADNISIGRSNYDTYDKSQEKTPNILLQRPNTLLTNSPLNKSRKGKEGTIRNSALLNGVQEEEDKLKLIATKQRVNKGADKDDLVVLKPFTLKVYVYANKVQRR